ncbi:MAG: hypothetical protein ACI9S8_002899 [Chlamydiales bacterium]
MYSLKAILIEKLGVMFMGKSIYWISTGLFCVYMGVISGVYLYRPEGVSEEFTRFGYPAYLVLPVAYLRLFGVLVLLLNKCNRIVEWAYMGFCTKISLGLFAHYMTHDEKHIPAVLALFLLVISALFRGYREELKTS